MIYRLLADAVVLTHLTYIAFVLIGAFLVWRWHFWAWLHIPAFLWGAWVELAGRVCPLTYLEDWLREKGGAAAYSGSFVDHYILPVMYPDHLTSHLETVLGIFVLAINAGIYGALVGRLWRKRVRQRTS